VVNTSDQKSVLWCLNVSCKQFTNVTWKLIADLQGELTGKFTSKKQTAKK